MAIGLNHDTQIAKPGEEVFLQVGSIFSNARSTAPSGYLLCDGSVISRTTYNRLFSAIGIIYGDGDGSTTFNIPDLRGAVPRGSGTSVGYTQNVTVALGSKQDDTIQGHRHNRRIDGQNEWSINTSSVGGYTVTSGGYNLTNEFSSGNPISDGANGTPRSNSNETKMKNLGINFFIKF
jgi:microcystin-dependent protein